MWCRARRRSLKSWALGGQSYSGRCQCCTAGASLWDHRQCISQRPVLTWPTTVSPQTPPSGASPQPCALAVSCNLPCHSPHQKGPIGNDHLLPANKHAYCELPCNVSCRIRHSPGAVQGRQALEEICDPPHPEPSRLELVAGDAGIRCSRSL